MAGGRQVHWLGTPSVQVLSWTVRALQEYATLLSLPCGCIVGSPVRIRRWGRRWKSDVVVQESIVPKGCQPGAHFTSTHVFRDKDAS